MVKEFAEEKVKLFNFQLVRQNTGINERNIDKITGKINIKIAPTYPSPINVVHLLGDAT